MPDGQRKLSEEVLNWYYVGDEIPAKEWATRIAELEARVKHLLEILDYNEEQNVALETEKQRLRDALEAVMDEYVPDSTKGDDGCPITRMAEQALEEIE
jgi:regulator of replication initiation timing